MAGESGETRYIEGRAQAQLMVVDNWGGLVPLTDVWGGSADDGGTVEITTMGTADAEVLVAARTGYTFHITDVNVGNRDLASTRTVYITDGDPATSVEHRHLITCGQDMSATDTELRKKGCTDSDGVYGWVEGAGAIGASVWIIIGGYWSKDA